MESFKKENIIKVGSRIRVEITDYSHEGLGIAHVDGLNEIGEELTNFPIFVFGMMVGEMGFVILKKVQSHLAYADVDTIYKDKKSVDHIIPKCPSYGICGGCNLMHMSYDAQLKFKTNMVKETLSKIGGFTDIEVSDCIGSNNPYEYRNKVQVPVASKYNGKLQCGFYERETHKITPLEKCFIQTNLSTEMVIFTKNILSEFGLSGYNEKTGTGTIRHIMVRKTHKNDHFMVVIVATSFSEIKNNPKIVGKLTTRYPQISSIILNLNTVKGNTILGNKCEVLYGDSYITDELLGKKFNIGPLSFYQVNHDQCEVLYKTAIDFANLKEDDILIDAYCGIGTIGLIASDKVKHVYGVEIIPEAIEMAKNNAVINNIKNATFECGKAEVVLPTWEQKGIKPNVVIVDPPRKGCDDNLLNTIILLKVERVVYVSCDVATLARDLKYLCDNGYVLNKVQPVDMFSQNNHVENVVSLQLK